jgi:inner membrane protein
MQNLFSNKIALVSAIILLLMIPLSMIKGLVSERISYRDQARADIERSWTGAQSVIGPLLVVPYDEITEKEVWDDEQKANRLVTLRQQHRLIVLPEQLRVAGQVKTEERHVGLYSIPVYTSNLRLSGRFDNRDIVNLINEPGHRRELKQPYVSVLIKDLRGIVSQPALAWQTKTLAFESGSGLKNDVQGMRAWPGGISGAKPAQYKFNLDLTMRGMEALSFAPLARDTQVQLNSDWPHPAFTGRFLPMDYSITPHGFNAQWLASSFSSGLTQIVSKCALGDCQPLLDSSFGVSLIKTIDIYQQAERSLKYGVLFLALTFALFFLYETLRQFAVHPVQYLFVGLALSIFYLLLVSLSEHIRFALAYLVASLACSSLLGVYVGSILRSLRSGFVLFAALNFLYGILYIILQSEDSALLMGSILMFSVLAALMLATRKVDWYAVKSGAAMQAPKTEPA